MPSQRLTDRSLRALKTEGQRVEVWDETLPGFGVRVSPTGRKVFIVRYRAGGKRRRVRVGRYPETSLADARDRAKVLLGQVVGGDDPVRIHREGKTFGELADIYLERYAKKNKREKSWREDERQLDKDVLPAWRDRPAGSIRRDDVHALLDTIADRAPVQANRTRALLSKVFNFGIDRGLVESNPVQGISRPTKERPRRRTLSDDEIRTLWEALVDEPPLIAASFKLRLITAQCGGEVLSMRDEDIQGDEWLIPAEHFKSDRPHLVPLSPQALSVLDEIRPLSDSPWVFPSRSKEGHIRWLSNATKRIRKRTGFHWTPHDLRRTAATNMTKMGVPRFVVGRVLGHAAHDVTGVYDVYDYAAEKRDALERWGERLEEIVEPERFAVEFDPPSRRLPGELTDEGYKEQLEADADADFDAFFLKLHEPRDIPASALKILEEYKRRGSPLDYWQVMPDGCQEIQLLISTGPSARVRQLIEALEGCSAIASSYEPSSDYFTYDRKWREMRAVLAEVEAAERRLVKFGFVFNERDDRYVLRFVAVTKPRGSVDEMVRQIYRNLKPHYERAWPLDVQARGVPTKNPGRLRQQIRKLLFPYLGQIRDSKMEAAIRYET